MVVQLTAKDADRAENARLSYEITSGNEAHRFDLATETGIISVKSELDFEIESEFRLIVKVNDHGQPPKSSLASVIIMLKDENDNVRNVWGGF